MEEVEDDDENGNQEPEKPDLKSEAPPATAEAANAPSKWPL